MTPVPKPRESTQHIEQLGAHVARIRAYVVQHREGLLRQGLQRGGAAAHDR